MVPRRIIWHHSADLAPIDQLDKINAYHKMRDFPISSLGYYVGYHWLIEKDGTVIQTRKETEVGAHDAGENADSLGICLAGNFDIELPSELQIAATTKLLGQIRNRWSIKITRIEPHRWDDETNCPGQLIDDDWLINQYIAREMYGYGKIFLWLAKKFNLL